MLLGLDDAAPGPRRFEDIPLIALGDAAPSFGDARATNLYNLHDHIVRVAAAPVVGTDGAPSGEVYLLQDLTSEVAMDRAKTNFIATISHELRTPLTVLGGNSELLLRNLVGPITDEQRSLIETMRKHTLTMTALLNNVIMIAGLESGTLTFDIAPVALDAVLKDTLWSIRAQVAAKGLALVVTLPDKLPRIMADSHQLRSALQQLLDNARRYTDAGTIQIRAGRQGDYVRIDISDTGRGIGPELSEQLFTRFSRGAEGINSAERGIGLGLVIARQLVEQQGGSLWLDQTSECGSTFSLMILVLMKTTTTTASQRRPRRQMLWLLVLSALLLGLLGVCGVSQLVLRLLTPYGMIYPHSLLAMYGADYRPWNPDDIALPPLNPQAAQAAERDLFDAVAGGLGSLSGVVPVAILPPGPADIVQAALQPTPTPTVATPTPTSTAMPPTPDTDSDATAETSTERVPETATVGAPTPAPTGAAATASVPTATDLPLATAPTATDIPISTPTLARHQHACADHAHTD